MALNHLLKRHNNYTKPLSYFSIYNRCFSSFPTSDENDQSSPSLKPSSLSSRMSFVFDQIDQIDRQRQEKEQSLHRIRSWHQSKTNPIHEEPPPPRRETVEVLERELPKRRKIEGSDSVVSKEVELVHPWREWIELMEMLVKRNYLDQKRMDEERMMERLGINLDDVAVPGEDEVGVEFVRDFKSVRTAMLNFGHDRFDIVRLLSRHDLQILVGYGCAASDDMGVVFSSKLLRKFVHVDEGDVCSSCSLRNSCEKAYLLTKKEEEAQTSDVMRVLLAYGFDLIDGSESSKSLLKLKSVKTVVRKLLHEVVSLSAVPIDPNLQRPIIKRPPPKVKQPPTPPKNRFGRHDVEAKVGDWLCSKCNLLNFAKNTVCLQCDNKRPKKELLPGEWECPQCNFLNYRRNTQCFRCEHNRPPDTYVQNEFPSRRYSPEMRMDKPSARPDISNAWNFDFDDNESDGADVATFEYADSCRMVENFPPSRQTMENARGLGDHIPRRSPNFSEREYSDAVTKPGVGFNDFDDDQDNIDNYEVVSQNEVSKSSRVRFSELEDDSDFEDMENNDDDNWHKRSSPPHSKKSSKPSSADSEDEIDFNSDDDLPVHPKWKSSHAADRKQQGRDRVALSYGSDSDLSDDETLRSNNKWGSGRIGRATHGRGRSISDDTDSDDDFGYSRNKSGRDHPRKASSGRGGMNRRPHSESDVTDSDDDFGYSRNKPGRDHPGKASSGRCGMNLRLHSESVGTDSDDDFGYNRNNQNNRSRRDGPRNGLNGRGGMNRRSSPISDVSDSDDDFGYNKNKQRDKSSRDGPRKASIGLGGRGGSNRSSSFSRNSGKDDFSSRKGGSKFQGRTQGGSFDKQGGSSSKSYGDSFPDDVGDLRPRNNVR